MHISQCPLTWVQYYVSVRASHLRAYRSGSSLFAPRYSSSIIWPRFYWFNYYQLGVVLIIPTPSENLIISLGSTFLRSWTIMLHGGITRKQRLLYTISTIPSHTLSYLLSCSVSALLRSTKTAALLSQYISYTSLYLEYTATCSNQVTFIFILSSSISGNHFLNRPIYLEILAIDPTHLCMSFAIKTYRES